MCYVTWKKRIPSTLTSYEALQLDPKYPSLRYVATVFCYRYRKWKRSLLVISAAYWWNHLMYQWKRTSWWTLGLDFYHMWPRNQGEFILYVFSNQMYLDIFIIINDRQHLNLLHFSFHSIQKEVEFQNASPITLALMFPKCIQVFTGPFVYWIV